MLKNFSPLKLLGKMEPNLAGSIYVKSNSSHLEWRVELSDTILKGTHPGTIYARFGPYIDASCQVWLYLAKLFQRRRFF
jgi:hypothetical protein